MYHRGATACSTSGEGTARVTPSGVVGAFPLPPPPPPSAVSRATFRASSSSPRRNRQGATSAPEAAARGVGGKYQVGSAERLQRAYARLRRRTIRCWGSTAQVAQFRRFSYGPDHIAMAVTVRRSRVIGAAACRLPGARNGRRQRRRSTCSRHDGRTAVPVTGRRGGIGQNSAAGRLPAAPADVGGV